ncbi:MAG: MarR family transcriptional regulator [Azospirillaceae bacterium]
MMAGTDALSALMRQAGIRADTVAATLSIDALLQRWRRRAVKREIGRLALVDLGLDLDLAQLDVLTAIAAPENEFGGEAGGETMVSTVAERLAIDPSRASRLVAEMVAAGHVRRAVSQTDGRRAVVQLTPSGQRVVDAVRAFKFLLLGDFLNDWSDRDLAALGRLLARFSAWTEEAPARRAKFAAEIEAIRIGLANGD